MCTDFCGDIDIHPKNFDKISISSNCVVFERFFTLSLELSFSVVLFFVVVVLCQTENESNFVCKPNAYFLFQQIHVHFSVWYIFAHKHSRHVLLITDIFLVRLYHSALSCVHVRIFCFSFLLAYLICFIFVMKQKTNYM